MAHSPRAAASPPRRRPRPPAAPLPAGAQPPLTAHALATTPPPAAALLHLRQDPVFATVLTAVAGMRTAYQGGDAFSALCRIVIGQQLSVRAAATIWHRAQALVPAWTPAAVLALPIPALRGAGLSQAKVTTIQGLARRIVEGHLDLAQLSDGTDEEVATRLRAVPGCGPWTIAMFLLFALERPDVFSAGDGGLRRAICSLYRLSPRAYERRVERIAAAWSPWRSIACRYLWAWLEAAPPQQRVPSRMRRGRGG